MKSRSEHGGNLRFLVGLTFIFLCIISFFCLKNREPPLGFPSQKKFLELLNLRNPEGFLDSVFQTVAPDEPEHRVVRAILLAFDSLSRRVNPEDLVSIEAIRSVLLVRCGYPLKALQTVKNILPGVQPGKERESLLEIKAEIERKLGMFREFALTVRELKLSGIDFWGNNASFPTNFKIIWLQPTAAGIIWVLLLLMPLAVVELDTRLWKKKFADGANQTRLFHSYRTSSITALECLFSAILVLFFKLPTSLGFSSESLIPGFLHLMASYFLCLIPNYLLEKTVRKTAWTFFFFLVTMIRLNFIQFQILIVPLFAAWVLRQMALRLPMWPILSPEGVSLGFAAITGALNLFFSFLIPSFMGFSKLTEYPPSEFAKTSNVQLYKWDVHGSGIHNSFAFGNLSCCQGIALTTPFLDNFSSNDIQAIVAHEIGHLKLGHLFLYLLAILDSTLLDGIYAAFRPLEVQKMLLTGPSIVQGAAIFGG
ncbi:M48 family metalloprotease, partial [bacterium]|nr:M48 family metalloprotease [bacterium]